MMPLESHDAPERKLAPSALFPVVLSGMSAFDLLLKHLPDHGKLSANS